MFGGTRRENDLEDEEASGLLDNNTEIVLKPAKKGLQLQSLFLIISLLFNAFFAFFGLFSLNRTQEFVASPSYEAGFASDLGMEQHETHLFSWLD
jgi:hypothetical protein